METLINVLAIIGGWVTISGVVVGLFALLQRGKQ